MGYVLFATTPRPALSPAQPPSQWVQGALSLGAKQRKSRTDHSPPSNGEVENAWSSTSTHQYVFTAWCLVKQWMRIHGIVLS
jgi:hypothetical protein